MSETIEITGNEMDEQVLLVPKFKKVEKSTSKKSNVARSDIGLLVSYKPENGLKIRVPARFWDDEKRYPAEEGGTPLNYICNNILGVVDRLSGTDDEITVNDFYKLLDYDKKGLLALETSVTPVKYTGVVQEALDFLMNDEKAGMGCGYSPVFRANVRIAREKFAKDGNLVPLKLSDFYGFISYTGNCAKPIIQYEWGDIPFGVKCRNQKKFNKVIDIKRMRSGGSSFFWPIEFMDNFTIISFNKKKDGGFEFHILEGDKNGNCKRSHYEANSSDLVTGLEELSCCFFDRFKKEEIRDAIAALEAAYAEAVSLKDVGYVNSDNLFVSDDLEEEGETYTIGEKTSAPSEDEIEEDEDEACVTEEPSNEETEEESEFN